MEIAKEKKKLKIIYQKYYEEKSNLELSKTLNSEKISKLNNEVISLKNENENDFSIFSPYDLENENEKRIETITNSIINLENDNSILNEKLDYLEKMLLTLESVLSESFLKCEKDKSDILSMNENDRQRIARELHDTTIQNLVHLIHKIEIASKYMEEDVIKARLELATVSKILKDTIGGVRELVYDLRPMTFDDLGFETTLKTYLHNVTANLDIDVSCSINFNDKKFNDLFLLTLFRIIQECVNNAIRHSQCKTIKLELSQIDDILSLIIEDDGVGLDSSILNENSKHFGIKIVKERVSLISGVCDFICKKGKGLAVEIRVPIK